MHPTATVIPTLFASLPQADQVAVLQELKKMVPAEIKYKLPSARELKTNRVHQLMEKLNNDAKETQLRLMKKHAE